MERLYYVECEHETAETSSRLEAKRIAAEWIKRGYNVDTIAVDVTDGGVQVAEKRAAPREGSGRQG
jgi:hypothetical protein